MLDTETGVLTEKVLKHEGNAVREFYAALERPVVVGIEAIGAMQLFLELLEELGIECRVGHPAKIRAAETANRSRKPRIGSMVVEDYLRPAGRPERQGARSYAQHTQASAGDCLIDPTAGTV
jgi:hypothetical protein